MIKKENNNGNNHNNMNNNMIIREPIYAIDEIVIEPI